MTRLLAFLFVLVLSPGLASAQLPQSIEMKLESASAKLSNLKLITCQRLVQDEKGTRPIEPIPFQQDKLYPPNTLFFLQFDYECDFQPSDDPKAIKSVNIAVEIPKRTETSIGGFVGHFPTSLKGEKGTTHIGLANVFTDEKTKLAEIETVLKLYGQRNDNTFVPEVNSTEKIKIKLSMDRLAQISETQFEALKGMYKRIQELEARVKQLEASGAQK